MLRAKFGWNRASGSEEEVEIVKSLQTDEQTDKQTDGRMEGRTDKKTEAGQKVIIKAHLSYHAA